MRVVTAAAPCSLLSPRGKAPELHSVMGASNNKAMGTLHQDQVSKRESRKPPHGEEAGPREEEL